MKPFDLMAAINGEKVVTKQNFPVVLKCFSFSDGAIEGIIFINPERPSEFSWDMNGKAFGGEGYNIYDLFMVTKKKKLWVFVCNEEIRSNDSIHSFHCRSACYLSKKDLLDSYKGVESWLDEGQIIEIEIEEE